MKITFTSKHTLDDDLTVELSYVYNCICFAKYISFMDFNNKSFNTLCMWNVFGSHFVLSMKFVAFKRLETSSSNLLIYWTFIVFVRCLCGLTGSALDHISLPPSSNLGMGISTGCFIFDFTSLPLEVAWPIYPTMCTKVAVKYQSSSSWLDL